MGCDEARQYLQQLMTGYQQGMCEPLLLFVVVVVQKD
ncbi:hypothetical protein [Yersinia bercovieri]